MSKRARGYAVKGSWCSPFYTPRKKAAAKPMTAEQLAKADEIFAKYLEDSGAHVPNERVIDKRAQQAVEGDTDLNHDNIEAAE